MTTRAMGPMAGLDWLKRGLNLGRHNPKAIFGGAAVLVAAVFVVALVVSLLMSGLAAAFGQGSAGAMAIGLLTIVLMLLAMSILMVGYFRLLDAVEHGQPARALDVLAAREGLPAIDEGGQERAASELGELCPPDAPVPLQIDKEALFAEAMRDAMRLHIRREAE